MQHSLIMTHVNRTARSHRTTSATPWFRQVIVITAFLCLGLTSESLASHVVRPSSLTFNARQGTNPPKQTLTFTKAPTYKATLTASDNATWLTVSPASQSETTRATLTVAVNTSGRAAGTYRATITVKEGTWFTQSIPVTLVISSGTSSASSSPPPAASTATLRWNAVTGTVTGYKIYVGEAPRRYTRTINVGKATTSTVNSLTVGKLYYFAVTAYNSAGESSYSTEVNKAIQ